MLDSEKRTKARFLKEFTEKLINASYKRKPDKIRKTKIRIIDPVLRTIVHGKAYN